MASLFLLACSAAWVGTVHSLAPGHWLPVVVMARAKRWTIPQSIVGALCVTAGHVVISCGIGVLTLLLNLHERVTDSNVENAEQMIERFFGWGLVAFGIGFALRAFFFHKRCHGHEHHGPELSKESQRTPYAFLFMLGVSPCVAALPLFVAASVHGTLVLMASMAAFGGGVLLALVGATTLVSAGVLKLDLPLFEHHGDVLTGLGVAATGALTLVLIS